MDPVESRQRRELFLPMISGDKRPGVTAVFSAAPAADAVHLPDTGLLVEIRDAVAAGAGMKWLSPRTTRTGPPAWGSHGTPNRSSGGMPATPSRRSTLTAPCVCSARDRGVIE